MNILDEKTSQTHDQESPLLPKTRENVQEINGASFLGAVFNLSTTIIGAGVMALPAIMKVLGLGLGIGMIVLVAVLTEFSLEILLRFSKAAKEESYGGVMGDAFGVSGRRVLQGFVMLNILGVLIVYTIIIGDVLSGTSASGAHHSGVFEGWFGSHWWTGRTFVLLFVTLSVFAPLACFKRMDSLRFTSALAFALAVFFLVITGGITLYKLVDGGVCMPRILPNITDITSFWNLFTVFPILVTAFICHVNIHTIENELKDSSLIQPVVRTSVALCSTVYILTSLFGILLFGDSTLDNVLTNFDTNLGVPYNNVLNDVIRISYALHLILVFPVVFHPLRLNLDGLLFPSARPLSSDNRRFTLISIALISVIFLGATFIPSIWVAFQFTGATSSNAIGFIFPAAVVLRDRHLVASKKDKIVSGFMIFLALFSSFVAIYSIQMH
ncbi:amino acid transporter AVT6A-like [Mercurialis annua]|uniref:amino acid transporter AVT6A-like n=1 Tax=Mercurialis annua TaxID=3986 RepID=UPI002161085B|nr:amino acid transporter AVT6A-like [Mercurialis annua]